MELTSVARFIAQAGFVTLTQTYNGIKTSSTPKIQKETKERAVHQYT